VFRECLGGLADEELRGAGEAQQGGQPQLQGRADSGFRV